MAFVVSSGQIATLAAPIAAGSTHLRLSDNLVSDYAQIWRAQPQVRTVISFLGRNIAQLGLGVFRRVSDTDRQRLAEHPLAVLLGSPWPRVTRYQLIDALVQDLALFDNAFWLKVRGASGLGLLRLPPRMVRPVGPSWVSPAMYEFAGGRGVHTFTADEVVHFHGYDPSTSGWGSSPIETLRQVLAEDYAAGAYREQLWRNGARVSGYLSRPVDAPNWSDPARQRFRQSWQSQYTGDGPQVGGTPVLEDGMSFTPAAISPADAQYIEARRLTREEVASAFHIPPPMVGILDHATFSNVEQQHRQLYSDTLGPWLEQITQVIEAQLVPDLPDANRVYVEFNLAAKLNGSFTEQATAFSTSVGRPWMTANEARARNNLPTVPGGDELIVPLNVTVGGQASPRDSAPPPKARRSKAGRWVRVKAAPGQLVDEAAEQLAGFFARQSRAVLSRAGAKAAADDLLDPDRWNPELAELLLGINQQYAAGVVAGLAAGGDLDQAAALDAMTGWLAANAEHAAEAINEATVEQVAAAQAAADPLAELTALFTAAQQVRARQIAITQATNVSGFAAEDAGPHAGFTHKTWVVTSSRPRSSHARMDGEAAAIGTKFSNGARWPGDRVLDEDDRAGCTCDMRLTTADREDS